jgi:hypothetical protein
MFVLGFLLGFNASVESSLVRGSFVDLYSFKPTVSNKLQINHRVINETFLNPRMVSRKIITISFAEFGHSSDYNKIDISELLQFMYETVS